MKGSELARYLEFEYRCEHCHERPAVLIFDQLTVCVRCHQELDRALSEEGESQ